MHHRAIDVSLITALFYLDPYVIPGALLCRRHSCIELDGIWQRLLATIECFNTGADWVALPQAYNRARKELVLARELESTVREQVKTLQVQNEELMRELIEERILKEELSEEV